MMLFPPPGTTTGGLGCPSGLLELPAKAFEDMQDIQDVGEAQSGLLSVEASFRDNLKGSNADIN